MSGPLVDNPVRLPPLDHPESQNPVFLPVSGAQGYAIVFESVRDVIDDYFEITYANRYDGRIETFPRTAPGIIRPWQPGSPDLSERWLATLQSIRHRASVLIQAAEDGGFFVDVKVYKELEDLAKPTEVRAGPAAFRSDPTVERQYEVVDPTVVAANWIPLGRDIALEQEILERVAEMSAACEEEKGSVTAFFQGLFSTEKK